MATRTAVLACLLTMLHLLGADSRRARESHSQYYGNQGNVQAVWQTAGKVAGKNPATHRVDASGTLIQRNQYGKAAAKPGGGPGSWEIDHMKPQSKGGSDHVHNLQALNTHDNRAFGNSENKKPRRTEP
jgi:5-methylcytosine-specific restriction endonuclease McrA